MTSAEAAAGFADASVDMVFIDGALEYESVAVDVALWAPIGNRLVLANHVERFFRVNAENFGLQYKVRPARGEN